MQVTAQICVQSCVASAKAGAQAAEDVDTDFAALLAASLPCDATATTEPAMSSIGLSLPAMMNKEPDKELISRADDAADTAIMDPSLLALLPDPRVITPPALQVRSKADADAEAASDTPAMNIRSTASSMLASPQRASIAGVGAVPEAATIETATHQPRTDGLLPGEISVPAGLSGPAESPTITHAAAAGTDIDPGMGTSGAVTHPAIPVESNAKPGMLHVSVPVHTDRWGQALGERMLWMAQKDVQSASLTLNPPDLGPVRVELQLNDIQAVASFSSAQPDVRKAIEDALPTLKILFAEAGLDLRQADVGSGHARDPGFQQERNDRSGTARDAESFALQSETTGTGVVVARRSRGLLDTFA